MTWMTSWPAKPHGRPTYAEHDTQTEAEAHAAEVVRRGDALVATAFEIDDNQETQ